MAEMATSHEQADEEGTRRDFLYLLTGATAVVGTAALVWPLVDSMNPSADVLALASTEVDLSGVEEGMRITVHVARQAGVHRPPDARGDRGRPRRSPLDELRDPQPDNARVIEPQWLVDGRRVHPSRLRSARPGARATREGDYGGWFCPCHGSHYDTSGRIRRGPAPRNLVVPEYAFTGDSMIRIG